MVIAGRSTRLTGQKDTRVALDSQSSRPRQEEYEHSQERVEGLVLTGPRERSV